MITLKHLKIFKEVARVKSMSKAAENLYISQPTISQKIQEIENYYHIKLFQRHSRTLGISEDGKLLLEHTNKILDEFDIIENLFSNKNDKTTIKFGSTLTVANAVTAKMLKNIEKKHPDIHFQVFVDNTQSIEEKLISYDLDVAIVEGDIHNDNIIHEPIIHDQLVLVCSKDHPLAKHDTIEISALENLPFIVREKGSGTRAMLDNFMRYHKISYTVEWQCHSWSSIKQAVIMNHGLTLISARLVQNEIDQGLLHVLKLPHWSWHRMFSLCYRKEYAMQSNLKIIKEEALHFAYCPIMDLIDSTNKKQ